jgi:hypothetical protein
LVLGKLNLRSLSFAKVQKIGLENVLGKQSVTEAERVDFNPLVVKLMYI